MMKNNDQKLVDLCFHIGITIHAYEILQKLSRKDLGTWVADQLRNNGFDTTPVGLSWGVLKIKLLNCPFCDMTPHFVNKDMPVCCENKNCSIFGIQMPMHTWNTRSK